jgi:hypothetical protein
MSWSAHSYGLRACRHWIFVTYQRADNDEILSGRKLLSWCYCAVLAITTSDRWHTVGSETSVARGPERLATPQHVSVVVLFGERPNQRIRRNTFAYFTVWRVSKNVLCFVYSDDGGSKFLRNLNNCVPVDMTSYTRRLESSFTRVGILMLATPR